MAQKISIITACFNEAENIGVLYERVRKTFENIEEDFEIVYVDDGSTDGSEKIYRSLVASDSRVRVILLSRNFGSTETAFLAGLHNTDSDAVILIDGDLQDPPELIPEFVKKWHEGFDVVYGVRRQREGSKIRNSGYKIFYKLFKRLSYIDVPVDAGNFGLMDRRVVDVIKTFDERDIRLRGVRAYAGFKQTGVEYVRDERSRGDAKTSLGSYIRFAKDLILNFSYKPLDLISKFAFIVVIFAFLFLILNLILYLTNPSSPQGIPTIVLLILFLGGVQLLAIATIGEYIGKIFEEVKKRPRYIIRDVIKNNEKN